MTSFTYVEKTTTSEDLLGTLREMFETEGLTATNNPTPFNFSDGKLFHQEPKPTSDEVSWKVMTAIPNANNKIKMLILQGTSTIAQGGGKDPLQKIFYVKFTNTGLNSTTTPVKHSQLEVQIGEKFDETANGGDGDLKAGECGHPVIYEWANHTPSKPTDRDLTKPVYLFMNVMNNRIAMMLVGDPAVNFTDYRKSFLYVGAIKPFKYNLEDSAHNVLLTAGAVAEIKTLTSGYDFGQYTSLGNNTFQMLKTKSGIRYQKHYPSFITQAPQPGLAATVNTNPDAKTPSNNFDTSLELEPQGFNASAWTRKYHLSPIYVVHPYDGYRGQLEYCIAVSKNNILHLDELIVDVTGQDKPWTQEVYIYFDHNTEQNFMNHSANVKMGLAFLKEVRYQDPSNTISTTITTTSA